VAQRTQIIWVDDVDGTEANETVTFGLDGVSYEIDLSDSNAASLRQALAGWVGNARKVGGRSAARGRTGGRQRAASDGKADLAAVRAWARENGFTISDRGRVSKDVLEAYNTAH